MTDRAVLLAWETEVVLRDGTGVRVRAARPQDEEALITFYRRLSDQSLVYRFFTRISDAALAEQVRRLLYNPKVVNLLVTFGEPPAVVAHGLYALEDSDRAEVAFAVADAFQGRGVGTLLLGQLAEVAARQGIRVFEASVLPTNHRMLEVFRESGFPVEVHAGPGELRVTFPTELTEEALQRFERREQRAAQAALQAFLRPRGVAVVGASRRRGTIGGEIFWNLLQYGFQGPVYPVNPYAQVVQGVVSYPTVEAIPGPVDLAVVAVPAEQVVEVAWQCARKGVRALVVISAGFAEAGEEGRARQEELLRVCRATGMRLVGPNCMGIVHTDPEVRLNATFAPVLPPPGRVGFLSQSGALGLAVMEYASQLGLGLSSFVSVGNKADVSGNDLLNYWEDDPNTDVILLYLESFGNPRKFSRIARRVSRRKPIVAVKSGRTGSGIRATTSHTGALVAASDTTVDALFRQAGVIRTDSLEEMFDVAVLLAHQPVPAGPHVGIVTNAGGPGILCADACEAEGLKVPVLSAATQQRLRELLPAHAAVTNPVDLMASAPANHYREAVAAVGADPNIDAVVVIFVPPLVTQADDVAQAIVDAVGRWPQRKPVLTVFMSARGVPELLRRSELRIPSYAFPESAARALAHAVRYGQWRSQPAEPPARPADARRDEALALVATAVERGAGWLGPREVEQLLNCYGIPLVAQRFVLGPGEAGEVSEDLGWPVALKVVAPGLVHKTEVGGVLLDLRSREEVEQAAQEMLARVQLAGYQVDGFVVQEMAAPGLEVIVGVASDRHFGPVVACGAGGVLVELLRDVSLRLAPLSRTDAAQMLRELRTFPLLQGYRGSPPCDVEALEDLVTRVGALAEDIPQVVELDLNPVRVYQRGVKVLDARVRVEAVRPPTWIARR